MSQVKRRAVAAANIAAVVTQQNLKGYARLAGINQIHLHQLRHSFAGMVAEESGSITETQEALIHRHVSTTRVYVQRVA